ncbi:caspase family protein [Streptomyces pilosus]|uniref:caspase family protein n=1 Tax=Streptomyces pilosus TaxID=28893 RepID=UPI0036FB5348
MTKRALLIGAQTYGLSGVGRDVAVMERLLAGRGFTDLRVRRTAGETTYDGMNQALARLAAETKEGDAVVVYYSGHGSLLPVPRDLRERRPGTPAHLQYLVPSDHDDSTATDFRGYLAEELTAVLRRLTSVTPNVTCVLDCCHSGGMARAPGRRRIRSVRSDVPADAGVARSAGLTTAVSLPDPRVVRLFACQRLGVAYEDERQGLFTAALAQALEDFRSRPVPWSVLMARVRDHVGLAGAFQRPDAGGPSGRLPFSLRTPAWSERLPLRAEAGGLRVSGGALFGLRAMDRVRLVFPADGTRPEGETEARVTAVDLADAVLEPPPGAPDGPLPPGSYALPLRIHTRQAVHVEARGPAADAVRKRLASSPRLEETGRRGEALCRVRAEEGRLEVTDGDGRPYRRHLAGPGPAETPSEAARRIVGLLETVARGERLRRLALDPGTDDFPARDLAARMEVETTPHSFDFRAFPQGGAMRAGDRYRVSVTGRADVPLYVWLLGVGLSGRTSLVTHDQPGGVAMEPSAGTPGLLHWESGPVDLWWPEDVPAGDGGRPESVLLLVGDRQMDLSPLGGTARRRGAEPAALSALLDEVCEGVRDSRLPDAVGALRYRVFGWHAAVEPPPPPGPPSP